MKTLYYLGAVAIAASMVACSNDDPEMRTVSGNTPISFSGFVGKNVRASSSQGALTTFHVWGYEQPTTSTDQIEIFNSEEVTYTDGAWTYSPLVYWTEGSSYWFAAISPYNISYVTYTPATVWPSEGKSIGTITFDNSAASGNVDLLTAYTDIDGKNVVAGYSTPVDLTFAHLLSQVNFKFANGFGTNEPVDLKITDITLQLIPSKGTLAPTSTSTLPEWTLGTSTFSIPITPSGRVLTPGTSNENTDYHYLFPATSAKNYEVVVTVSRMNNNVVEASYTHTINLPDVELKMGWSYTFVATFNADNLDPNGTLHPITFTASVNDWNASTDQSMEI